MPNLVIACPVCLQKIRAPENVIGRNIKCPQCKNSFIAADPSAPAGSMSSTSDSESAPPVADPLGLDDAGDSDHLPKRANAFVDYLLFRRMVTPVIITALFYCGAVALLILGLVTGIRGILALADKQVTNGLILISSAIVGTIVWLVLWRIWCEIVILFFQILAKLRDIHDELSKL